MREDFKKGDIVKHFKRELIPDLRREDTEYLYKVIGIGTHTETKEKVVIYQAMYTSKYVTCGDIFVRPYDMFMSRVDKEKYPDIKQEYRFEKKID